MPISDPIARAEYNKRYLKQHYLNNKKYYYDKKVRRKKETLEFVNNLKKDKPCMDCGKIYPPYAMDYDHRDAKQKYRSISLMIIGGISTKRILLEIEKCDLVCAVCHRIRTYNRYSPFV